MECYSLQDGIIQANWYDCPKEDKKNRSLSPGTLEILKLPFSVTPAETKRTYSWSEHMSSAEKKTQDTWRAVQDPDSLEELEDLGKGEIASLEEYIICKDSDRDKDKEPRVHIEGRGRADNKGNAEADVGIGVSKENEKGGKWSLEAEGTVRRDKDGKTSGGVGLRGTLDF